jgi:PAS domain S-box-containing protein
MSEYGRRDHWSASLDIVERLRRRLQEVEVPEHDELARQLMAQVAHAKSSSFILLLDRRGLILDVNPAALIAGGADRSEIVGLPLWSTPWWELVSEQDSQMLRNAVVAAGDGRLTRFDIELGDDGTTLDMLLRPLRARDGQVAFVVAEGRPVTDRKRVEQRLARQNAELSALTERLARVHDYRERLLGELSHDLRAPLQVVITRAEQVLRSQPAPEVRSQLVSIRLAALSALEQINDMLEQVKADHGEVRLTLVDADLAQAVRTVAEQFEPLANDRDIALTVDVPETTAARFDVERISRVVSNLLANAIRHTPVGGRVRLQLKVGDGTATLLVGDSGPGVPVEHRDTVFGRFRSGLDGDGRSNGLGAGLGLAIVRETVRAHGGRVRLEDASPGLRAVVRLPLTRPPADS